MTPATPTTHVLEALRARLMAEYAPVNRLRSPLVRAMWLSPLAALALLAAPLVFGMRPDAVRLGPGLTWGASSVQALIAFALLVAALRESVPGRAWSWPWAVVWLTAPIALLGLVTAASWEASPVLLRSEWGLVGVACFVGSAASALPVVALAGILAASAYPTRPALAGALLGLGAGLMADAGWRLFCHFSEPAHVLSAHLGAVLVSVLLGSVLASAICRARRRS